MPHRTDRTLTQFLLTIAVVIVVSFFNWMKRRGQSEEPAATDSERKFSPPARPVRPSTPGVPRPAPPNRPVRKFNWEEELRRMLGVPETGTPPLPPKPAHQAEFPAPTPPPLVPPLPLPTRRPAPIRPIVVEQDQGLPVHLPGLTVSTQTYERASQLDQTVAEHIQEVGQGVRLHAVRTQATAASQEVARTRAWVGDKRSLRSVIMASVILGPPKALES